MANEIYKVSWWGYSSPNGFGSIYNKYTTDDLADGYSLRVIADGGTVEALSCLSALDLSAYNWNYNYRVVNDGGTIEAMECVPLY